MFTGIIAMDPAGPIFETYSIGNIHTYIYQEKSNYLQKINIEVTFIIFSTLKRLPSRSLRCRMGGSSPYTHDAAWLRGNAYFI